MTFSLEVMSKLFLKFKNFYFDFKGIIIVGLFGMRDDNWDFPDTFFD
jgi:hypothetical protein